ncbi:GARE1-like protein [Mya arenaria]|uniref:GARE1-like protein n=1 Tax=Mya arenaria TaxID=6604 RepID=A0ABY7FLC2_MYAAR|nr:uncharacterized protein LOC128213415 [Mya arenaria]WAR23020.1 GARE1-like protein [Mya arenaria]
MNTGQIFTYGRTGGDGSSTGNGASSFTNGDTQSWEEKSRSLRDIITRGKYPCLVKVKGSVIRKYMPQKSPGSSPTNPGAGLTGNPTNDDEILHVIELRRHKMVVATRLQWERRTNEYTRTDKHVDINVAQKGWFEVLPDNGQPVEYFDTINAIVGLRPKQFLVRTSIVGYELSMENGVNSWVPWEIRPGEVLTTGIVHMDQKRTKKKTLFKRIFSSNKNSGKKEQDLKYLQCFDADNREIMVPLIMTGVFSPVGDQSNTNFDAVYNLHDLISAFNLPIKVQLIHSDAQANNHVPSGVLLLERLKDSETVLVARHPYVEHVSETFQLPVDQDIQVTKERKKRQKSLTTVSNSDPLIDNANDIVDAPEIVLPIRIKESKKSKGSAILEKLSVRSKSRKERASLKALQEEGIFSSRLSKSDLTFEDFYANGESDDAKSKPSDETIVKDSVQSPAAGVSQSKQELDIENGYSVSTKRSAMQDRDLPPIPSKTKSPTKRTQYTKENDYEELPLAPRPPHLYLSQGTSENHDHDDGYMTPARFRELNEESKGDYDNVVKRKPPTAPKPDYARISRARKAKSDYASPPSRSNCDNNDTVQNIEHLFDYALAEGADETPVTSSPYGKRQLPNTPGSYQRSIPRRGSHDNRVFHDDFEIGAKSLSGFAKLKSRSQKNLNMETNATIRSHNVRKMRTAMDVFGNSDSLRDLRQPLQLDGNDQPVEPMYGRVVDSDRIKSYVYAQQNPYGRLGNHYVESEPGFRRYSRANSNAALSDSFPKHGDDSAISINSRGEYGLLPGESDYSYSEYSEWHDDGWIPPDDISTLSVLEVSKSLRYIGMKDRVVIRFSREQIDGNMLQTLDVKLLKEGFPELNALDVKKILDFVSGWRPKK